MNYNDVMEILKNSSQSDWIFDDSKGSYTYRDDLNLRIQRKEIDFNLDKFAGEDWATKHPDSVAYKSIYEIYYNSSYVERKTLVLVDGLRATLPMPTINTNQIPADEYKFAQIVDHGGRLDEYIERAQLQVVV